MTTTAPYSWVKKIEDSLRTMQLIPLWGSPPVFPWQAISEYLRETLNLEKLEITLEGSEWVSDQQIATSMGASPIKLDVALTPLLGTAHWLMSRQDVSKLTSSILASISTKGFSDPQFQEGFYRYLALEALNALSAFAPFEDLSATLAEPASEPKISALCLNIRIVCNKQTLWGKLVCPDAFHKAFAAHFALRRPSLLSGELAQTLDLPVHVEIGKTTLSLEKWKKVTQGDCILLDQCSYDPHTHKGNATLVLDKEPIFHLRIKGDQIKILEYIFYTEENMDNTTHGDEPPEDNFERENTPEGEEMSEQDDASSETSSGEHLWAEADDAESASLAASRGQEPAPHEGSLEHLITTRNIPLTLTVEVARMRMSLEKMLQLQPGNLIDLAIKPEHGVHLTLNGALVAKGELVKIGESIGVKILQIAKE